MKFFYFKRNTGDILFASKVDITNDDTGESLFDKLAESGASLITEALDKIEQGDVFEIENYLDQIPARRVVLKDATKGFEFAVRLDLSDSEVQVALAGGQLRFLKRQLKEMGVETHEQ